MAVGTSFCDPEIFERTAEAVVGDHDDTDVRIDGAEGIVRRFRLAGAGDGVEEGGFSDVREAYDSGFEHCGRRLRGSGDLGEKIFL